MIIEITQDSLDLLDNSFLSKSNIEKELTNNPFAKIYIYLEHDKIKGYLYYSDIYERVEINQIEVEISNRGKGIGTKLLTYLTNKVCKDITLEVKKDNIAAIKLYKKFQFMEVAIRKGYYQGIDGILMERKSHI